MYSQRRLQHTGITTLDRLLACRHHRHARQHPPCPAPFPLPSAAPSSPARRAQRYALVTGGNRGIGFEVCKRLVEQGKPVIVAARDPAQGVRLGCALDPVLAGLMIVR